MSTNLDIKQQQNCTQFTLNTMIEDVNSAFSPDKSALKLHSEKNSKCLPILYYGTDVCPLTTKQINSLQFVINSCFSKMFMIKCDDDIKY